MAPALSSRAAAQAGFGITDLDPMWHPRPERAMFDVGRASQLDGETSNARLASFMATLLQAAAGVCSGGICKVLPQPDACLRSGALLRPSAAARPDRPRLPRSMWLAAHICSSLCS